MDYVRNVAIAFFGVGLWHGAGWNFMAWGLYHAILLVVYRWATPVWEGFPRVLKVALTFSLVALAWFKMC